MTWWNSPDTVSFASSVAQVLVALIGIAALVIGIRSSQLQNKQQQENLLNIATAKKRSSKGERKSS